MTSRTPKPCTCPLTRHRHGTKAAYQQCGCRCYPCTNAYLTANRSWRNGITEPRRPPTIPAHGTRRRLEALHAVGWSDNELAKRLGMTFQYVHKLRALHDRVLPVTAEAVAELYDALWDKPAEGKHAVKVRNHAARLGYLPPLAFDDDRIDDPDYQPHMPTAGPWEHRPCGTDAAYRRHLRNGEKPCLECNSANRIRKADAEAKRKAAA